MTRIMLDRNKTNVDVMENNYKRLKKNAEEERYNVKEYTNTVIKLVLDKMEYAKKHWPYLAIYSVDNNTITLTDTMTKSLVDLKLDPKDSKLHCELDRDMNCPHMMYALFMPQSAQLSVVAAAANDNIEKIEYTETA